MPSAWCGNPFANNDHEDSKQNKKAAFPFFDLKICISAMTAVVNGGPIL